MKLQTLLSVVTITTTLSFFCPKQSVAQSKYFIYPDQIEETSTSTKSRATVQHINAIDNSEQQRKQQENQQKSQKQPTPKYNKKFKPEMTSTASLISQYEELKHEHEVLTAQINTILLAQQNASKSMSRILDKQFNECQNNIKVLERQMAVFPDYIQKGITTIPTTQYDEEFHQQLDELVEMKISQTDPFAGQLSQDPQLDRVYRDYLQNSAQYQVFNTQSGQEVNTDGLKYRIMFAITRYGLNHHAFGNMIEIYEQRLSNGATIYYQGSYDNILSAQNACNNIIQHTRFKDAFVVAMRGNQRVAIPQSALHQLQQYNQPQQHSTAPLSNNVNNLTWAF